MATQKIAFLGGSGMLATRLAHYLSYNAGFQPFLLPHAKADVTDKASLQSALGAIKPDWVINCSAFLNADRCEKEPENSKAVNFQGAVNAAEVANALGAKFIQFSTDYVFDGKTGGYSESDVPQPICNYGLHKFMADEAILKMNMPAYILRTASVIGSGVGKPDIVQALLGRVAKGAAKLEVIDDMRISLSTPRFLATIIEQIITLHPQPGLYNAVASDQTTWLGAAQEAFKALGVNVPFEGISMEKFQRIAPRPQNSWLKTDKLAALIPVPTWQQAVQEQMTELKESYVALLKQASAA